MSSSFKWRSVFLYLLKSPEIQETLVFTSISSSSIVLKWLRWQNLRPLSPTTNSCLNCSSSEYFASPDSATLPFKSVHFCALFSCLIWQKLRQLIELVESLMVAGYHLCLSRSLYCSCSWWQHSVLFIFKFASAVGKNWRLLLRVKSACFYDRWTLDPTCGVNFQKRLLDADFWRCTMDSGLLCHF